MVMESASFLIPVITRDLPGAFPKILCIHGPFSGSREEDG